MYRVPGDLEVFTLSQLGLATLGVFKAPALAAGAGLRRLRRAFGRGRSSDPGL